MTNGDEIRQMSDEALAVMFSEILYEKDREFMGKLQEAGVDATLIHIPDADVQMQLDWLRSPANGGDGDG